jgi:hypothetical protein
VGKATDPAKYMTMHRTVLHNNELSGFKMPMVPAIRNPSAPVPPDTDSKPAWEMQTNR